MYARKLIGFACGLAMASACWAQVKLNASAQPATGHSGITAENLTGSGFPSGAISPASVTISLARACNGAAAATATASLVTTIAGTSKRVSFTIPASTPAGTYAVSVKGASFTTATCSVITVLAADAFLRSTGGDLTLNGVPFRYGGGNSYELMYSDHTSIDQVFQTAANQDFKMVRTWGFLDIGNQDGSNSVRGPQNGYYFHYWDGSKPAYNDGANGLENLDYVIYSAGQHGMKLIIPFTNNYIDFGGMDQYVRWLGGQYHDQFYTDPTIRQWYKEWIAHLLNRVNTYSGLAYKDDPTIAIWELSNEPRCTGSGASGGGYASSGSCTTQTLTSWVTDVSAYVKSVDANHLVAVGDEGFFCTNPASSDFTQNCSQGVDTVAFTRVPTIDLMGFHLYPEGWGMTTAWSDGYIDQHIQSAKSLGKPAYMGEFGLLSGNNRNAIYQDWTNRILNEGATGGLFWDLVTGLPGAPSAEADGSFDVYDGAPLLTTMRNFAESLSANTPLAFPPVADDQWATTPFNQDVTLNPIQNDVAYAGASVNPNTLDLDPSTPGEQTSVSVYGGQFSVSGQKVVFTPNAGFNGSTLTPYTVQDSNQRLSNIAYLNVTVKPSQTGYLTIESFETGTDGWSPLTTGDGSVAQSTAFHTDGTHSLQVTVASTGWYGVNFPASLDLSGRPSLAIDLQTTGMGGGVGISFQSGSNYTWCQTQSPFPTVSTNTVTTLTLPLDAAHLDCGGGSPDLTQVESFHVYLPGPGTFYLDYLRAAPSTVVPTPSVELFSFETGTQGWAQVNPGGGTVKQTTAFHTDGHYGLEIDATSGDWFGGTLPMPVDLTGKTSISADFEAGSASTSTEISIETGPNYTWCQGTSFPYVTAGGSTTVTIPLDVTKLQCYGDGKLYLDQVHVVNVYVNGAGTYYVDNVRAQ